MGRTVDRILESIDLKEYMERHGWTLYRIGNCYGCKEHSSVRVFDNNTYFHPGTGENRRLNVINFAEYYYDISNKEAIKMLAKELNDNPSWKRERKPHISNPQLEKKAELHLPQKQSDKYSRVYAYLTKERCLSKSVVTDLFKRHMLYEDVRGNVTFVGYHEGKESFCFQRASNNFVPEGRKRPFTRIIEGSDFSRAWYVDNGSTKLFVTEAIIDSASAMTMFELHGYDPKAYDYVATCGPSRNPVLNYIMSHPQIDTVYLGYDNDSAGKTYRQKTRSELREIGYEGRIVDKIPHTKDFNNDLQVLSNSTFKPENNQNKQISEVQMPLAPERMIPR